MSENLLEACQKFIAQVDLTEDGEYYDIDPQDLKEFCEAVEKAQSRKYWSCIYSLESITDFYADDDFEDAINEVTGDNNDLSQRVRITVEKVE